MTKTSLRRPASSQVRVTVNATGTMIAAAITDVGLLANGFVRGDRVAYPASLGENSVIGVDSLIGIPRNVSDWQAADLLAPGLVARAMITRVRPFFYGERVAVRLSNRMLRSVVAAWVSELGGILVDDGADTPHSAGMRGDTEAYVVYDDSLVHQATVEASHRQGRLQQAATEVFQAIRDGVFDSVTIGEHHPDRIAA